MWMGSEDGKKNPVGCRQLHLKKTRRHAKKKDEIHSGDRLDM